MTRSGYSEDCDGPELNLWRGAVASAIRGKRGQAFLREALAALELEVVAAYGRDCFEAGRAQPGRALQSHTINAAKTVAVATDVYWQPTETAPRGVKVQLLGKGNVATYGTYYGDQFWTHWCPLPKRAKE